MATSTMTTPSLGYQCEFIDSVPEDFYCKQCSLVARRLTTTSCCGESYCNVCIQSTQQDNKPCPGCGQENFETFQLVKYQRKIMSLQVSCSVKERGCVWCGPLEHLDAHLDPDTGDCEYTDIHCPLKCQQKINKKNLEHHLAKECVKRDYTCPYCAFKATFEIVTESHWPECSYYPLACPNHCGVTCERPTMEDHLKICRLNQVECEFQHIGCLEKFSREDYKEHMREKAQTHLTMMAATSVKMQQEFQVKIQEQEKRFGEKQSASEQEFQAKLKEQESRFEEKQSAQEQEFQAKIQEQEKRFGEKQSASEQEFQAKLKEQESRFEEKLSAQERQFEEKLKTQEEKLKEQIAGFENLKKSVKTEYEDLKNRCGLCRTFTMEDFSTEKAKDLHDWLSPPMYTHLRGYKFRIGINANGYMSSQGKSVNVTLWAMKGEYDDELKWPVTAEFTIELVNHYQNGRNMACTITSSWTKKPYYYYNRQEFETLPGTESHFISHSELLRNPATRTHFLKDDALHFNVTKITPTLEESI